MFAGVNMFVRLTQTLPEPPGEEKMSSEKGPKHIYA